MNDIIIAASNGIFVPFLRKKKQSNNVIAKKACNMLEQYNLSPSERVEKLFAVSYKKDIDNYLDVVALLKLSDPKRLEVGDTSWYSEKFNSLVTTTENLSEEDMRIFKYMLRFMPDVVKEGLPNYIPKREFLTIVASYNYIVPVTCSTDVLRIISYFSGKSSSLVLGKHIANKFKRLSRMSLVKKEYILNLLEGVVDFKEMWWYKEYWEAFMDIINIEYFKHTHPRSYATLRKLKNFTLYPSYREISTAFSKGTFKGIAEMSKYPKLFIRNLISLIKLEPYQHEEILRIFTKTFYKYPKKELFMLINYLNKFEVISDEVLYGTKLKQHFISKDNVISKKIHIALVQAVLSIIRSKSHDSLDSNTWIDPKFKYGKFNSNLTDKALNVISPLVGAHVPLHLKSNTVTIWISWKLASKIVPYITLYNIDTSVVKRIYFPKPIIRAGELVASITLDIRKLQKDYSIILFNVENYNNTSLVEKETKLGINTTGTITTTTTNFVNLTSHGKLISVGMLDLEEEDWVHLDSSINDISDIPRYVDYLVTKPMISAYDIIKASVNPVLPEKAVEFDYTKSIIYNDINMNTLVKKYLV